MPVAQPVSAQPRAYTALTTWFRTGRFPASSTKEEKRGKYRSSGFLITGGAHVPYDMADSCGPLA